jgi:hypothetical protein
VLVYGDRRRHRDPRMMAAGLSEAQARLSGMAPGLDRHAATVAALIEAGRLAQGLADLAFQETGADGRDPAASAAMEVALDLARQVVRSWSNGFQAIGTGSDAAARLAAVSLPDAIEVRGCEGYAFYAVYPELYAEAARGTFSAPPRVVGLRSIGTSLAATVAAATGAAAPITLRPTGAPFDRELKPSPALRTELLAPAAAGFAVVDEGPGLSGSSFDAAGRLLMEAGAVVYMPSHAGEPGGAAPPGRLARWRAARKAHVPFEAAIEPRLAAWVRPLIGEVRAVTVISAGAWRDALPEAHRPPAWPEQERRKYRVETDEGAFLLKFAGLGADGEAKLRRARRLHEGGFTAEPMGLVHGFLVERWVKGEPLVPNAARQEVLIERLADYLGFRARHLPEEDLDGADAEMLRTMIRRNLGLVGLDEVAERACAALPSQRALRPMVVDGRLHAWEWIRTEDGRLVKTDALDHCQAHDLVGAQDLAWDVAGAAVEFGLDAEETERLRTRVEASAGHTIERRAVSALTAAYLAFQIGWWRMAAEGVEGARALDRARTYERICACWTPV